MGIRAEELISRMVRKLSRENGGSGFWLKVKKLDGLVKSVWAKKKECDRCGKELSIVNYYALQRLCMDCHEELLEEDD